MSLLPTPRKPVNYLNNKDILVEIHISKNSYCSFTSPHHHRYDLIINTPDKSLQESLSTLLLPETILAAKTAKAARSSAETKSKVSPDTIHTDDLIFRVMTWEHIPTMVKPRKQAKKTIKEIIMSDDQPEDLFAELEDGTAVEVDDTVHVKVNFPPFQHYIIENDMAICVGKSHWQGDLTTGSFCKDHGRLTNKLASMYKMLCDKYATRYNWRNYSYLSEMQSSALLQLTYVGLRFNEARSDNPFSFYTQTVNNSFYRVMATEKKNQNLRDDILQMNNMAPSWSRQNDSDNDRPRFEA